MAIIAGSFVLQTAVLAAGKGSEKMQEISARQSRKAQPPTSLASSRR